MCAQRASGRKRDAKNRHDREKERERDSAACVAAGVRLIVVSNRLYPGILIRSQLSALVAARDEQNVVRVYCEKRDSNGERIRDESPIPRCARPVYVTEYPSTNVRIAYTYTWIPTLEIRPARLRHDSGTCARKCAPIRRSGRTSPAVVKVSTHSGLSSGALPIRNNRSPAKTARLSRNFRRC